MEEKTYLTASDLTKLLGVGIGKAYEVIRRLNKELDAKGYITISGKVNKKYFYEKYYS